MNIPDNLKYTNDHEYVRKDNNIAVIGITDYAQSQLGDIIFMDFTKNVGDEVKAGDTIGSIEAVKTVSEVFSPVSGKIAEINTAVNDNASVVNEDPYGVGWLFKIEMSDVAEYDSLLTAENYNSIIGA